jgi:hypothetical protein
MMMPKATSTTDVAEAFFDACERGKGWEVCHAYCTPNATFSAQAEPIAGPKNARTVHRLDERHLNRPVAFCFRSEEGYQGEALG